MKTHSEMINFFPCVNGIKDELELYGFYNHVYIDWIVITDYYVNALIQDPMYLALTIDPLKEILTEVMVTDVVNTATELARSLYWDMLYRNIDNDLATALKEKRPGTYASAKHSGAHNFLIDIIQDTSEEAEWLCGVNQRLLK